MPPDVTSKLHIIYEDPPINSFLRINAVEQFHKLISNPDLYLIKLQKIKDNSLQLKRAAAYELAAVIGEDDPKVELLRELFGKIYFFVNEYKDDKDELRKKLLGCAKELGIFLDEKNKFISLSRTEKTLDKDQSLRKYILNKLRDEKIFSALLVGLFIGIGSWVWYVSVSVYNLTNLRTEAVITTAVKYLESRQASELIAPQVSTKIKEVVESLNNELFDIRRNLLILKNSQSDLEKKIDAILAVNEYPEEKGRKAGLFIGRIVYYGDSYKGWAIRGIIYNPSIAYVGLNLNYKWGMDKKVIKSYLGKKILLQNYLIKGEKPIEATVIDFNEDENTSVIATVSTSLLKKLGGSTKLGGLEKCAVVLKYEVPD